MANLSERAGIRKMEHLDNGKKAASYRHEVAVCHGFRKFFSSQLVESDLKTELRSLLEGHNLKGNDSSYVRTTEQRLLQEYLKAVSNLTINEENRLRMKVQSLQVEEDKQLKIEQLQRQIKQMQEQTDKKLDSLTFDMDKWKEQFMQDLDKTAAIRKRRAQP